MDNNGKKPTGAVLVQGGGIAGIQAALDLANAGFRVYLVEREPAIGGKMAQLDKTFPTGDCATCIISPKLVECARNTNIIILTLAEMEKLEGEPGNFKATVRVRPRYVDETKCTACGQCAEVCPVNIPNRFDRNLGSRKAVAKYYPQATPNVYGILKNGHAPCKVACPANVNVQGYVQLIKKKEYLKAVDLIRERNPLAAICGRICTHPCEAECTRNNVDDAVAIRLLKRFASDKEMAMLASGELALPAEKTPPADAKKVAIIGAGPAGLAAADDLADRGVAVTVYEAAPAAGGMLRWGIPDYRLPKNILDHEVELIRRKGVKFIYNTRIGADISLDDIRAANDAVFIAAGAQAGRRLGVTGEDNPGVIDSVAFLRQAAGKDKPVLKGKVAVVGGGNAAMDAARTARRLGAREVTIIYRRSREEMPATEEEIEAALAEGIRIEFLTNPRRIAQTDGHLTMTCVSMKLGDIDETGRRRPEPIIGSEYDTGYDTIIAAIGQALEKPWTSGSPLTVERGYIKADPVTLETAVKGIFAGGDAVSGPASVIEAVAAGKRAAESMARYINGADMRAARFEESVRPLPPELLPTTKGKEKKRRAAPATLAVSERNSFNEVEAGLNEEQALAEAERCLNCALCAECLQCVGACDQSAIDHCMKDRTVELDVGAVIMAPGFNEFPAAKKGEFGFGRYANVLTSLQFERMLSASGPCEGHIIRPADGKPAKRIAWIQCVGSRDSRCGNEYCSSVCCMVATKQALVASDHQPGLQAAVFYLDIRAHGKDFDQYYERARQAGNIDYIKGIPSRVQEDPATKDLKLQYIDNGQLRERDFDLVILSVGMEPDPATVAAAERLGIARNEYGFCATDRLSPLATSRPGVFAAGSFQEPKDIPETVTQASAAAAMAMELLAPARNSLVSQKAFPDEHDVTDEAPRIGVFVCHCGHNIASVVDVEKVKNEAAKEPGVVFAADTMFTCSDSSLNNIRDMISEHHLNRVVVASCTPRTHEPIFRDTLREAGLNPYLFELANIRDQCSWVHAAVPEAATQKAIELVKMSIARARRLTPLQGAHFSVNQTGLVIGGGVSGMTAVLSLADQGFKTVLIEKTGQLGGNFRNLHYTLEHEEVGSFLAKMAARVASHPNIDLHLNTEVKNVAGFIGSFEITLAENGSTGKVTGGAVIVATGAAPALTHDFRMGQSPRIITQLDLEKALAEGTFKAPGNTVMIQCAGSRNDERPYCSRICCAMAVKNALRIKQRDPEAGVYIIYRDIRTYGFREKYYKQAREAGVIFIRYEKEAPPVISGDDELCVTLNSPDFPETIEIEADSVVLSTGVDAPKENRRLADMLKVPLNADGYFVEAHLKLRPVDFATEGIFLCGLAHSPKMADENIAQARAAAARAATILSKTQLEVSAQVSSVDQDKCISCLTCIRACPYNAPFVNNNRKAEINAAKCMGCGICVAECPAHAVQLRHFESEQFRAMIDALLQEIRDKAKKIALPE